MSLAWRTSRRTVFVRAAAVCALLLAGVAVRADAGPGPADGVRSAAPVAGAARAAVVTPTGKYGIPPLPYDPTGNTLPYGGAAVGTATSVKQKVTVSLPNTHLLAYVKFCLALPFGPGVPTVETCCPDETASSCTKLNPPTSDYDSSGNIYWTRIAGRVWFDSPAGVRPIYGSLVPIKVHALAFGSIPVTATIHLRQTVGSDGLFEPLSFFYEVSGDFPAGSHVTGYGTVPDSPYAPGSGSDVYLPAKLTGNLDLRVSDVAVDGVPVDVGTHCRTARPSRLTLGAPGGFAAKRADDTPISAFYGRPGAFTTEPGGQLYGTLDIPAFAGCGNGHEDLDPLLTGLVSAPANPVQATNTETLQECATTPGDGGAYCPPFPREPAPSAQAATANAAAAPAALRAPRMVARLATALRALPRTQRAAALASLPASVARQVEGQLK